ncbi:MAG TPA: hypothetical protein VN913_07475 [Candidatus Binatus sp.]|nr:hypothetical protein [Candidatus Binatus sp.]
MGVGVGVVLGLGVGVGVGRRADGEAMATPPCVLLGEAASLDDALDVGSFCCGPR